MAVLFKRLAVIGTGLMGGSVALAAKHHGLVSEVIGYSRRLSTAQEARRLGVVDVAVDQIDKALEGADAVYVAAPVAQFPAVFAQMAPVIERLPVAQRPVMFDAGSTKGDVYAAVLQASVNAPSFAQQFVLCHPIAGAERHGPSAATAALHTGRTLVMCPVAETSADAYARVKSFWQALGVRLKEMPAAEHDDMFAAVSHLPHWLAYAYVSSQLGHADGEKFMAEGGGGFRDFTRIAASSPEMWMDIFQANKAPLLAHLDRFEAQLLMMRSALEQGDSEGLRVVLDQAAQFRSSWKA